MRNLILENPSVKVPPFLRHSQPDGTIDSICPICYRPIARSRNKKTVVLKEKIHICSVDDLSFRPHYGPF
jgi:hypothetical protein